MSKKATKKDTSMKKVMKKTEPAVKNVPQKNSSVRQMTNKVLTQVKGLTLVENKHGAVQIKRGGDLMFSFRTNGKCIITHPIFTGKGKSKERFCKHIGTQFDNLSDVPYDQVTIAMLVARCKDSKSRADYHAEFYGGKNNEKSGLFIKAERARLRIKALKNETKSTKNVKKRESKKATKAKKSVSARTKTQASKKSNKSVIKKVAKATA